MVQPNAVLNAVSDDERRRLLAHSERVHLPSGTILAEPGEAMRHAYFPLDGVISLLALTANGTAAEVAMIGNDGVVGIPTSARSW